MVSKQITAAVYDFLILRYYSNFNVAWQFLKALSMLNASNPCSISYFVYSLYALCFEFLQVKLAVFRFLLALLDVLVRGPYV